MWELLILLWSFCQITYNEDKEGYFNSDDTVDLNHPDELVFEKEQGDGEIEDTYFGDDDVDEPHN